MFTSIFIEDVDYNFLFCSAFLWLRYQIHVGLMEMSQEVFSDIFLERIGVTSLNIW